MLSKSVKSSRVKMSYETFPLRRIAVVAMDGSEDSEAALKYYVQEIHKDTDDVILMHCITHRAPPIIGSVHVPSDHEIITQTYQEETEKGDEVCKQLKKILDTLNIGGRVMRLEGNDPGYTITQASEELEADFIVVGSRGHGAIRQTLVGGVSGYILHHANVPVFICRH